MRCFRGIILILIVISIIQKESLAAFINFVDDTTKKMSIVEDDPIAAMLDSLAYSKLFECYDNYRDVIVDHYNFGVNEVILNDSILAERFKVLANRSPFPYTYNQYVKNYIELYAIKKRTHVEKVMGLAQLYFPMFEEILDQYNLPLELKYLAVVESALNPFAVSRAKATGIWQFVYKTAKLYGLNITSYIDERFDPYKQTFAACEYLQDLYSIYGDWNLVLAAYNAGPGNVNKAIRRAGGKVDYWEIYPYLPKETRNYVPAFNAISYVINYADYYGIKPLKPRITYFHLDTVLVTQSVSFKQIAAILNITEDELLFLNPSYKKRYVPVSFEPMRLVLPSNLVGDFLVNQQAIYNYKTLDEFTRQQELLAKLKITKEELASLKTPVVEQNEDSILIAQEQEIQNQQEETEHEIVEVKKFYKIKKGDNLTALSRKLGCTVADLKKWNNLKSEKLQIDKVLVYYVKEKVVKKQEPEQELKKKENNKTSRNYKFYTIQKGDTLWNIATRHGVSVENIKQFNNITDNFILKPGSKIKIPIKG